MPQKHFKTLPQRRTRRLPSWFRVNPTTNEHYLTIRHLLKEKRLHTVCEEAACPNRFECWSRKTATFMILGDVCTRACGFCDVTFGRPVGVDYDEPARLAEVVATLGLVYVVITSVNRDELSDGGASVFAESIRQIKLRVPGCRVEVLIPDFQGEEAALEVVLDAHPYVLGHNIETVPRLYPLVRPQAKYNRSLQVLRWAHERGQVTKSAMMLGLGERLEEVHAAMEDLARVGCDILTLGQYLQPTDRHLPVSEFIHPDAFVGLAREGKRMGFQHVEAGPLVRSSYHAESAPISIGTSKNLLRGPIAT